MINMRKFLLSGIVALSLGATAGLTLCSTVIASPGAAATGGKKSAFCSANISLDKAAVNVASASQLLAMLKSHPAALKALKQNAPSGAVGRQVKALINAANQAISTNNPNVLNNPSLAGGDIDTYCGVNGVGTPLPKYFAKGKGSAFCGQFVPIYTAAGNSSSIAATLAVLVAHKTQIAQLAAKVPQLPSSVRSQANTEMKSVQTAISQNSTTVLNQSGPPTVLALYCGQNS
jgi:hypothetical protein